MSCGSSDPHRRLACTTDRDLYRHRFGRTQNIFWQVVLSCIIPRIDLSGRGKISFAEAYSLGVVYLQRSFGGYGSWTLHQVINCCFGHYLYRHHRPWSDMRERVLGYWEHVIMLMPLGFSGHKMPNALCHLSWSVGIIASNLGTAPHLAFSKFWKRSKTFLYLWYLIIIWYQYFMYSPSWGQIYGIRHCYIWHMPITVVGRGIIHTAFDKE